jgi:S-adenosylmethionine:tRNA ribosyltransferase-isomerase
MLVSDFDYHLPQKLIAQIPLSEREKSRMMVCNRKTGDIFHAHFSDFPGYCRKEDIIVLNSSKVIPAKIWGKKEDGRTIEFLFLKEIGEKTWEAMCRPARHLKQGDRVIFATDAAARVVEIKHEGKRVIQFQSGDVLSLLKKAGYAPLPPYIKRKRADLDYRSEDLKRYQTVFARKEGSIAAPTAGLHFTQELLTQIKKKGITVCELSLDVGLATFQPVRAQKVEDHPMLAESYEISQDTAMIITEGLKNKHPVTAVGTTSVRALESAYEDERIRSGRFSTDLFIYPSYKFKAVDKLLTNFHLPKSTLLMLVSAFAGRDFILEAYRQAVRNKYRFYSYGDCMLIL